MSTPRPYYRDLDGHDAANDEHVSAAFFDPLALPPARGLRKGYRPSLAHEIREAMSSPAGRARSTRASDPAPAVSGSSAARGHTSKETR